MKLDPFAVEVIRHGLSAAAEEMSLVMTRSARSPLLREAGDLSSAITDAKGDLVGQGRDIPIHLGAMAYTVPELLKVLPVESLNDGDVLIYNLGALGGNHLNDVKVVRPVFVDGNIVAFAISLAHWPDIGGTWPGSYFAKAIDTFQEAMRIPPVLIATAEGVSAPIMQLLKANVRDPQACEGDLLGQIAATKAGEKRIVELCRQHGKDAFVAALTRLHDLSEIEMREAIRALPDGVYEGEDYLDDGGAGGEPARIHVKITIAGDEATFDLSGSADRVSNFCNTTPFIILEPGWTAAVAAGNHETSMRIVDAIFRAMEDAIPERLSAGGATTAGVLFFAEPRSDGSWKMLYEVHGGGEGARHNRDGVSATRVHLANTSNTPAEVIEANYRIRVEQQSIRRESGGVGNYRGGDGVVRSYRVLAPSMHLTTCIERMVIPPFGMQGGKPGQTCRVSLIRGGTNVEIDGKSNLVLQQDDLVTIESCGGGGYGAA